MPNSRSKVRSERLRYGFVSLLIGALLAVLIIANAQHERHSGNAQIADDSLMMLWSPVAFAVAGAVFLGRALVQERQLKPRAPSHTVAAERGRRVQARPESPAAAAPTKRAAGTGGAAPTSTDPQTQEPEPTAAERPLNDRYRQACAELGVEPGTDWMVIRAIWRRNLQNWHPDQGGNHDIWLRKTSAYTLLEAWEQFKT